MRICVIGAPGSGKTTLAAISSLIAASSLLVFHGDAFITETNSRLKELGALLRDSPDWIFEHIASLLICLELKITPDYLLVIEPSLPELEYRRSIGGKLSITGDYPQILQQVKNQVLQCKSLDIKVIVGSSVEDILPKLIKELWHTGCLAQRLNSVIVKVASLCNLNCNYCYMYQMHDTSWKKSPKTITPGIAEQLGIRLAEFLAHSEQPSIGVIFHGGEPLLLGANGMAETVDSILKGAGRYTPRLSFGVQTNGVLLNEEMLTILDKYGFSVGISMDGGSQNSNGDRIYHSGKPAFTEILRGLRAAQDYAWKKGRFSGALCVVNPETSGRRTYDELVNLGLNKFDFLLRDENWETPPRTNAFEFMAGAFDGWLSDQQGRTIRVFSTLVNGLFGVTDGTEAFGLRPYAALSVNVDGHFEQHDVLRAAYPGAWQLPYSLSDTSIQDVLLSQEMLQGWLDRFSLPTECIECRYLFVCGGGYLPHRYSRKNRFCNPSVHCNSIKQFLSYAEHSISQQFEST
jgi:uncharacterized protein